MGTVFYNADGLPFYSLENIELISGSVYHVLSVGTNGYSGVVASDLLTYQFTCINEFEEYTFKRYVKTDENDDWEAEEIFVDSVDDDCEYYFRYTGENTAPKILINCTTISG